MLVQFSTLIAEVNLRIRLECYLCKFLSLKTYLGRLGVPSEPVRYRFHLYAWPSLITATSRNVRTNIKWYVKLSIRIYQWKRSALCIIR